eukprot:364772-Chlamydomonas_euryale.AAC.9
MHAMCTALPSQPHNPSLFTPAQAQLAQYSRVCCRRSFEVAGSRSGLVARPFGLTFSSREPRV